MIFIGNIRHFLILYCTFYEKNKFRLYLQIQKMLAPF